VTANSAEHLVSSMHHAASKPLTISPPVAERRPRRAFADVRNDQMSNGDGVQTHGGTLEFSMTEEANDRPDAADSAEVRRRLRGDQRVLK
jgi:hypothetical protein